MKTVFGGVILAASMLFSLPAGAQTWNIQPVDDTADFYLPRIAVLSDGTPYIVYSDGSQNVYVSWWVPSGDTGGWERVKLTGAQSHWTYSKGCAVDANDDIHLALPHSSAGIYYGVFDPDTQDWSLGPENFTTEEGNSDLVLLDDGMMVTPAICYLQSDGVMLATRDELGSWSLVTAYDEPAVTGASVSMAADSNGYLHICFHEVGLTNGNLRYLTNAPGGTWTSSYVTLGGVGAYSDIVVDADDLPYIVYYQYSTKDLKYAKLVP